MRFGAIDLLAPPAGRNIFVIDLCSFFLLQFIIFPHRNTGLPNLQESYVGTLFPRSVHNGPSSPIYTLYIHTVCVYTGVFFAIFIDFLDFLWILWIFWVFYWIFLLFLFVFIPSFLKKKNGACSSLIFLSPIKFS